MAQQRDPLAGLPRRFWRALRAHGLRDAIGSARQRLAAYDWHQCLLRLLFAVVIGALAGLACVGICVCVRGSNELWQRVPGMFWLLPTLGMASVALYRALGLKAYLPPSPGDDHLVAHMRADTPVKAATGLGMVGGTCLSLMGGASVGPDAAVKQFGAALGGIVGRVFWRNERHRPKGAMRFATAAGLGACFSALLVSPLGVFAYTVEMARYHDVRIGRWPTLLVACCVAAAVAEPFGCGLSVPSPGAFPTDGRALVMVMVVGVACAVAGTFYRLLVKGLKQGVRRRIGRPWLSILVGCVAVAAVNLFVPGAADLTGVGTRLLPGAFGGTAQSLGFLGKICLTALALGFGLRGGEVTPLFVMGALLGCSVSRLLGLPTGPSCAVGLIAMFGVCSESPVAAVLMGMGFFAMDAGAAAALALAGAMAVAWFASRPLHRGVDALLARIAKK